MGPCFRGRVYGFRVCSHRSWRCVCVIRMYTRGFVWDFVCSIRCSRARQHSSRFAHTEASHCVVISKATINHWKNYFRQSRTNPVRNKLNNNLMKTTGVARNSNVSRCYCWNESKNWPIQCRSWIVEVLVVTRPPKENLKCPPMASDIFQFTLS